MCGIAGIVGRRGDSTPAVERMLDALRHRGPDDSGILSRPECVLGHRRLSIIDLEGGRQPIANEDGTCWIVCNGEIYNYQSLRDQLLEKGHRFSTSSDSEVILHLYEDQGESCLEQLRGMFAFAIWDERTRTLFAARDRLGQKPFYYHHAGGSFLFASEIKGLLAADPSLAQLNPRALDQYLTLRIIASPLSMFHAISKLPPAHWMRLSADGALEIRRYWDISYCPKLEADDEELTDRLEEILIETLRLHMVSDVPVGAFMSGGLDSTLVVAMTQKHVATEPMETFTIGLPYGKYDESAAARAVAERYGTRHHEARMTPSIADTLPDLVAALDEPSDPLSVCAWAVSRMASEHVKVVLGGDGGDELFGGYDRYYGNRYAEIYRKVPEFVRRYLVGTILGRIPDGQWYKSAAHQMKWLHEMSFLDGALRYASSLSYFYFGGEWRGSLYGDRMKDAVDGFDPVGVVCDQYQSAVADDVVDRMLHSDSFVRLPDHPVMIQDRMTMHHGLEARAPLMDHVLAEFAARLPARMKVRGRKLRFIQYKLASRYLPEEVLNRPKQGFSSALPYMLRDEYELLYRLFLQDMHLVRDGWLKGGVVEKLLSEHTRGGYDHGNRLWLLLNSEVWYRMYINGQSASELAAYIQSAGRGGRCDMRGPAAVA